MAGGGWRTKTGTPMKTPLEKLRLLRSHPGMKSLPLYHIGMSGLQYYIRGDGSAYPPLKIYLVVNTVCNANCRMCDVNKKNVDSDFARIMQLDGGKTEVPIERLRRLSGEFTLFKPIISVMGTEPLLYSNIVEAAELFTRAGSPFCLTTNGILLPKYAGALVDAGAEQILISLDGPRAVHDAIRGVKGIFDRAEESAHLIAEAKKRRGTTKPYLDLNFTLSNDNMEHITEFGEAVRDWGVRSVHFNHTNFVTPDMAAAHNAAAPELSMSPESCTYFDPYKMDAGVIHTQIQDLKKIFGPRLHLIPDLDRAGINTLYHEHHRFVTQKRCILPWGAVTILADGSLIPTTRCFRLDCGNVADRPFMQEWNGEKMRRFRRMLKRDGAYPACARCCAIY